MVRSPAPSGKACTEFARSLLIMPAAEYRHLSDDDVQALVAYLRSHRRARRGHAQTPALNPSPGAPGLTSLFGFEKRGEQPVGQQRGRTPAGTPEYGKYMIDIIGCASCHGDRLQGRADTGQPGPPPGPNLTRLDAAVE